MSKLTLHLNLTTAARLVHGLVAASLVAGLLHFGAKLYTEFYLPYNLEDDPISPAAHVRDDPNAKLILQTAQQLGQRQATSAATTLNVFWPATPTASTTSELSTPVAPARQ